MEIYDWDKTIHTNYLQTCLKKTLELHIPKWDLLPMLKYEQLKNWPCYYIHLFPTGMSG